MGNYTLTGPFVNGSSPGISASFLNNVETCISQGGMIYFLGTPYQLYTNPTLNNGVTRTDTVTGVGGIPSSGVLGVMIGVGIVPSGATGYVQIAPHGGTLGNYVNFSSVVSGQYSTGFVITPVSTAGQIDVKANGANIVLQGWYIIGYIM